MHQAHDPYHYSCGRWLRDDTARRQARHMKFNFQLLCDRVVKLSPGATAVKSWHKKEGGFNRVFIMDLDSGARLVARVPYPDVGLPQTLSTASEVATIAYLQQHTSVPIPKVVEWNTDPRNDVGCEYIIMEEARGVLLSHKWNGMTTPQRVSCMDSIFQNMKQLHDLNFPGYGSVHSDNISSLELTKLGLETGFYLSQHCGTRYWDGGSRTCTSLNRGPWKDMCGFSDSLVDVGIARIPTGLSSELRRPYQGRTGEHAKLLAIGRSILRQLSSSSIIQKASTPLLYHPDLHTRNIFVSEHDPTVVTDIIDWQGASVEPAFWYADEIPDFATSNDEICAQTFAVCSSFLLPKLALPKQMNENLFRPYRYCYRTWKDGIPAFRHELAETLKHWTDLELEVDPPDVPSDVICEDQKAYNMFVTAQTLKKDLADLLGCETDGWVRAEAYDQTEKAHGELFRGMLQAVLQADAHDPSETVNDEETLRAIWPFDLEI
ncbi:kinase-like domain-containing protein [Elsinoe ampelina]|uniref:Altered inheritance of mitochondria protein 9, mitochondrial n=1 Tax=Elsinoe ampelina TaxID=302913 RepID=A0A6A6G7B4_9PEZI|nr:kinase-like domain-containing protein [Elsinoe ampelina]